MGIEARSSPLASLFWLNLNIHNVAIHNDKRLNGWTFDRFANKSHPRAVAFADQVALLTRGSGCTPALLERVGAPHSFFLSQI